MVQSLGLGVVWALTATQGHVWVFEATAGVVVVMSMEHVNTKVNWSDAVQRQHHHLLVLG